MSDDPVKHADQAEKQVSRQANDAEAILLIATKQIRRGKRKPDQADRQNKPSDQSRFTGCDAAIEKEEDGDTRSRQNRK
ncbi:MAG: hypothetical protein WBD40_05800 [Tepidisphaeraceae bacterium]